MWLLSLTIGGHSSVVKLCYFFKIAANLKAFSQGFYQSNLAIYTQKSLQVLTKDKVNLQKFLYMPYMFVLKVLWSSMYFLIVYLKKKHTQKQVENIFVSYVLEKGPVRQ